MPFVRAGQLARPTPSARFDDPLGLVAENLRASHYGAIPVLDRAILPDDNRAELPPARVLGLITEQDMAHAVLPVLAYSETVRHEAAVGGGVEHGASGGGFVSGPPEPDGYFSYTPNGNGDGANGYHDGAVRPPVDVASLTARDVMRPDLGIVPALFSLHNALLTLERYNSPALPVVDAAGHYRGMISRADIVAALGEYVRPPVVGGMATPLGVWLTTGSLSAGAPPLGLFLSGMVMAFCLCMSQILCLVGLNFINQEWALMFMSGRLGGLSDNGTLFNFVVTGVQGLLFLLVLRALPMSGIHAAEHQTVWAIEKGLPLTPEYVGQMPRAHPRCGTNLVALGGLIQITFQHLPVINPTTILFTLLFIYLMWRNLGTLLQEWFTTKPATPKQLESGIKAGRELLQKYQEQPHMMLTFGMRLFNSGLIGSALGMMLVMLAYNYLEVYVARLLFP